ncbi:hypothetical protein SAMN04489844_2767 [Nocardioides exalbidus]|uniref:Sulfotransferase family protein n=1 Tax=Nocardioides exalbidus TaxID=402596 RepID=A0A1H4UH72_9ACTN|nr:hypothetical protein [Nocardioides exalbidus]SEC68025.1 hypothetical protein SAMN04489844_2767 [Nocardioides exalbidus]
MARRVFLHCGTAKSGTTYLQDLWWRHRDALRDRGLLLPGEALRDHFHAAALVKGMDVIVDDLDPADRDVWRRLVAETRAWDGDVLISHEHFSDSTADAAAAALADLAAAADEVHLVVTVRDLGRVLPSAWQQRVKQGARQPYRKFLATVRRGDDDQKFWRYQDVVGILDRWAADLPGERVHLVVVPPPGADRDELWLRTASVLGVDVGGLDTDPRLPNDSLSIVEAELLRRVNTVIPRERRSVALTRLTKGAFARDLLAGSAPKEPFVLPAKHAGWVRERSEEMVAALREGQYDVVGELTDLLPADPRSGRTPDQASDGELLAVATTVVARMIEQEP